jgi:phosphoglucomutase
MTTPNIEIIKQKANLWTQPPFDEATRLLVNQMLADNSPELTESFYRELEFGTGGLRGIMGPGTNRVNVYTIAMATQGLCNYLKTCGIINPKAAIAYDCRHNSRLFAETTAAVFSANGVTAYLFNELRPTPHLSFAVRHFGCHTGVVVTASHNPPEYNGYKVYWEDGGQIVAPHDKNIIAEVRKINSIDQVKMTKNPELIIPMGVEMDRIYLDAIKPLSLLNNPSATSKLKIAFTSLHGTGFTLIPGALNQTGFTQVAIVESQNQPDANFSTVKSPNPEEREALTEVLKLGEQTGADIALGIDPDADRVGIAVRNLNNELELLNGNQAASVLIYYLLEKWRTANKLTGKEFICKTIVTSDLLSEIATGYGVKFYDTLTGFKFIAEVIGRLEGKETFIGGGEESYGYLVGDLVRDKDAVISSVMLCEAAAWAKENGSSFFEKMLEIYVRFGCYREGLVSVTRKGIQGAEEIENLMNTLRNEPPKSLDGVEVTHLADYKSGIITNLMDNSTSTTGLPNSNVLQFTLADGSKITARPSGTEPKIKFYFSLKSKLVDVSNFNEVWEKLGQRIKRITAELPIPRY